uniref:Uncharacterized protein n=1 Tax=Pseudo-nitzschia australis TaxID=44445 RepID=A0A7S4AIM1_9STRA
MNNGQLIVRWKKSPLVLNAINNTEFAIIVQQIHDCSDRCVCRYFSIHRACNGAILSECPATMATRTAIPSEARLGMSSNPVFVVRMSRNSDVVIENRYGDTS